LIDVHCHLTFKGLRERVDEVVEESKNYLKAIITCGFPFEASEGERRGLTDTGFRSALKALSLARKYKGYVFVTLGLHPVQAVMMNRKEVEEYMDFIKEHKGEIVGIGEIGLDRHWIKDEGKFSWSREVFEEMLSLAEELRKPVVLHLRKAEGEGFRIVSRTNLSKVLFHSFAGSMTVAKEVVEAGYYFSLNTRIATIKNAKKIARRAPLHLILTETDSPFLSPTNDPVNRPLNVRVVVEEIAKLRGLTFEEVDLTTTENAIRFFGLPLTLEEGP